MVAGMATVGGRASHSALVASAGRARANCHYRSQRAAIESWPARHGCGVGFQFAQQPRRATCARTAARCDVTNRRYQRCAAAQPTTGPPADFADGAGHSADRVDMARAAALAVALGGAELVVRGPQCECRSPRANAGRPLDLAHPWTAARASNAGVGCARGRRRDRNRTRSDPFHPTEFAAVDFAWGWPQSDLGAERIGGGRLVVCARLAQP